MGNCLSRNRRENQFANYTQLQQFSDNSSEDSKTSDAEDVHIQELERQLTSVSKELNLGKQRLLSLQEERDEQQETLAAKSNHIQELERQLVSVNEELKMVQKERETQHQTLSARIEGLERDLEPLRNELETERLSKERELRKMTTNRENREKEVAEYKKRIASLTQELETRKQKPFPVQEEQSVEDSIQSQPLKHFSLGSDHSQRTTAEPTLGSHNLKELVNELKDVTAHWFSLGVQLEVPYSELNVISSDHRGNAKRCMMEMMQCWLKCTLNAKWSTIVHALARIGDKKLAHKIAQDHGIATAGIDDVDIASAAVGENLMEHSSMVQKKLMENVDDLRRNVKSTHLKLKEQEQLLKEAEHDGDAIRGSLASVKERMSSHHSRIEELIEEKMELEKALKYREAEVEILKESARKERAYLIALREEEAAEYQKKLESVEQKLQEQRQKILPLKEEIHCLILELEKKSEEIHHLRNARDEINSQLKMERERVEMKTKELTAAAVSHAVHMKEVQMQLASLEESKEQNVKIICSLQESVQQKNLKIKALSQQIAEEEGQDRDRMSMELADMKINMIQLQNEMDQMRTTLQLSQEEASYYQEHATALRTATRRPIKLALKWSDRKRAPEPLLRGAAAVHGTIAYIIGRDSRSTIYRYRFDQNRWNKLSKCPRINPGLVIINDLLTAVGGKEGGHPTNKLVSFNRTAEWVETFPPMQTPRESPAVVHYGNYVIAMGGDREERGVELFHIPSLRWSTATSLPRSLLGITATLCHDGIIAMDYLGCAYRKNIKSLITSIRLKEPSTEYSEWISLPECPGRCPTLSTICGQCLVASCNGIFQLQEGQWMVVVGGWSPDYSTSTDAVRVAIIV